MSKPVLARLFQWANAVLVPLAVIVAVWILVRESPEALSALRLDPWLVALSFVIECTGLLLAIPVWRHLVGRFGVRAAPRDHIRIYCYSSLGYVLPGGVWSIVSRSGQYQRLGANAMHVAVASVVETLMLGVAATLVYALVLLWRPALALWQRPWVGIGLALLALLLLHPRFFTALARFAWRRARQPTGPALARFGYRELLLWVAVECLVILIGGLALYVLLNSIVPAPQALPHAIAAWASAAAASNLFFWLPGTPIVRDGVIVLALTSVVPLPAALLFIAVLRIWTIMSLVIVAGLVWFWFDSPFLRSSPPRSSHNG